MNNNYLCHHGIKGQRWGVRNGPPYPIQNDYISRDTRINKNNKAAINEIFDTMSTKDKSCYGLDGRKVKSSLVTMNMTMAA